MDFMFEKFAILFLFLFNKTKILFIYRVYFQLPKIMELVGLGYTGWFVYRYLLFKVHFSQYSLMTL